ncbi:MAG: aspartate kinase [Anaerolineales bacterium]|nr:aspartate kinase [Anaerolineales bacterium]
MDADVRIENANAGGVERTLLMKFGGTSVGTPGAMHQAVRIVRETQADWPRLAVVTSALSGVTNLLLDTALDAEKGNCSLIEPARSKMQQMHAEIAAELITDAAQRKNIMEEIEQLLAEFASLCRAICVLGEATQRALDAVGSLGERMCARLLAGAIQDAGLPAQAVDATRLIQTDDAFGNAHPDFEATRQRTRQVLEPLLSQKIVPVVTGFIAATATGVTTTLGRGGSDYSAGILAGALPAEQVWIWTDVDGVMSADPRIVAEARTIPSLTYREVAELAYYGAKVLHPKTIRPVVEAGIGLRICNVFNPAHPGTRLVDNGANGWQGEIKAVTAIQRQRLVTIEGRGMLGVPGVAARAFSAVAATGTSVPMITQASSEQSICFALPDEAVEDVIASLNAAFWIELEKRDIDRIWATDEVVIVTVVGVGMIQTPGIAGRVFSALGAQKVNVIAIAQGSSEVLISLVVDARDGVKAVRALHALIVPSEPEG